MVSIDTYRRWLKSLMPLREAVFFAAVAIGLSLMIGGSVIVLQAWRLRGSTRLGVRMVALGLVWTLLVPGAFLMLTSGNVE
jgi:hypothetical protein